jgi:hypothetical protein
MKRFTLLLALTGVSLAAANPGLSEVKTVYLLPMANALDQFLAIRLTTGPVVQVVTDPQKADAVLTDHIGVAFEQRLEELYALKSQPEGREAASKDNGKPAMQPLSRGKGTIFLVDRKTGNVLWSTYVLSKGSAPDDVKHVADRIAAQLEKDRKVK